MKDTSLKNSKKLYNKYWKEASYLGHHTQDLGNNYVRTLELDFDRRCVLKDEVCILSHNIFFDLEGESIMYYKSI